MNGFKGAHYQYETGLTTIGLVCVLMIIGFFALLVLKITPIYMENYQVKTLLSSLEKEPLTSRSKREIISLIEKRLDINNIRKVSIADHVEVLKRPEFVTITIDYEVTEPIMGNLEVLVYFLEEITVEK